MGQVQCQRQMPRQGAYRPRSLHSYCHIYQVAPLVRYSQCEVFPPPTGSAMYLAPSLFVVSKSVGINWRSWNSGRSLPTKDNSTHAITLLVVSSCCIRARRASATAAKVNPRLEINRTPYLSEIIPTNGRINDGMVKFKNIAPVAPENQWKVCLVKVRRTTSMALTKIVLMRHPYNAANMRWFWRKPPIIVHQYGSFATADEVSRQHERSGVVIVESPSSTVDSCRFPFAIALLGEFPFLREELLVESLCPLYFAAVFLSIMSRMRTKLMRTTPRPMMKTG